MSSAKIALIVAVARRNVIGAGNALPWRAPEDIRRFRDLTMGKSVIMGRKTYDGLQGPLPNRHLIVVSRNPCFEIRVGEVAKTIHEAVDAAKAQARRTHATEIMIAGGAEIYRQTIEFADRIYMTKIDIDVDGDAFFPQMDPRRWTLSEQSEQDEKANFAFLTFSKR